MVSTPGFDFLHLPSLAQSNIVQLLDIPDLFLFSLCSETCESIVRKAQIPTGKVHFYLNKGCRITTYEITIQLRNGDLCLFYTTSRSPSQLSHSQETIGITLPKRRGELSMTWKELETKTLRIFHKDSEHLVRNICDHIFAIFKVPQCSMDAYNVPRNILRCILRHSFSSIVTWKRLYLNYGSCEDTSSLFIFYPYLQGSYDFLEFEDLELILDLKIDRLDLNHPRFPASCKYRKPLRPQIMTLHNAYWRE